MINIEQIAEIYNDAQYKFLKASGDEDARPWSKTSKADKEVVTETVRDVIAGDAESCALLDGVLLAAGYDLPKEIGVDLAKDPDETVITKVILNNNEPAFLGIKQGDKMLLSAKLETGSKLMVKGHVQSHHDYPRKDNVELMEL